MEDERKKRSFPWPVLIVLLLVMYPLSFGPVCWLCDSGCLSGLPTWMDAAIEVFYWPIGFLYRTFPWFERLMDWYISLWPH